jgi:precorrin-2 methylase
VIVVVNGVVAILACVALIISLANVSQRLTTIQTSRQHAAYDFCTTFQHIIRVAYGRSQSRQGGRLLTSTGLSDCTKYAHKVVKK